MTRKSKKNKRTIRMRGTNVRDKVEKLNQLLDGKGPIAEAEENERDENIELVMAELTPGRISAGFRIGNEDTIDLFAEDLSPQEATKLVADISQSHVDIEELGRRPMREFYFPIDHSQVKPPIKYHYTLPEDDEEVMVSSIAMAIIDIAKLPPLQDAHEIQQRALWHCEMSRTHIRVGELTNDYEGFKQLFIANYTNIYERDPHELSGVRDIINRYDIQTALVEIRNIVQGLYFPNLADLERLEVEYEAVRMKPHRSLDGYYATFLCKQTVMRTQNQSTPMLALAQAQQIIDKLNKENEQ